MIQQKYDFLVGTHYCLPMLLSTHGPNRINVITFTSAKTNHDHVSSKSLLELSESLRMYSNPFSLLLPQVLPKLSLSIVAEMESILGNKPHSKKDLRS